MKSLKKLKILDGFAQREIKHLHLPKPDLSKNSYHR